MANSRVLILTVSAVVILAMAGVSHGRNDRFFVEGQVYCDTCRFQFVTRLSEYLEGAKVKLECRNITGGTITYEAETVTDRQGIYSIPVDGDYEDDICEIQLVSSPNPDCTEIPNDAISKQAAKVSLTANNGVTSPIRTANPLGFMHKKALPECSEVMKELDLTPDAHN